jgi:peptide deformylase
MPKTPSFKIVQSGHPILRAAAGDVPVKSIGTPKIKKILKEMAAAIASRDDAVAIAAPQLGYPLRMFMVSGKIFESEEPEIGAEKTYADRNFVFINPILTKVSKRKEAMEEGCLSVDAQYGMVRRSQKATVRAHDEHGNAFEWGGSGLLAQIFQHEVDHLNGVLFIDTAKNLRKVSAKEAISLRHESR